MKLFYEQIAKPYQIARFLVWLVVKSLEAVLWVFQVQQDFVFFTSHATVWLTGMTLLFILCWYGPMSNLIKTNGTARCCYSRFFPTRSNSFDTLLFKSFTTFCLIIQQFISQHKALSNFLWEVCKHSLPSLWNT